MTKDHWLLEVSRRAGLPVETGEDFYSLSVPDVWSYVVSEAEISAFELARMVALHFRLELADLSDIEERAVALVPGSVAKDHGLMPIRETYHHLVIATSDPTDYEAEQAVAFASGRVIELQVATPEEISECLAEHYTEDRAIQGLMKGPGWDSAAEVQLVDDRNEVTIGEDEAHSEPVVRLTNLLLKEAVAAGASDIHLEPVDKGGDVRIRVDGVLRKHMHMPLHALIRVISRVKVMGLLDIADRVRPQDGRARIKVEGRAYDLRISTVPAREAEKAVIRILDPEKTAGGLDDVGIPEPELSLIRRVCKRPDGIFIVTGPTGSGKTTTLYSVLRELATDRVNIMTVEDPVEYQLPGVTQIQIEPKRGVTFANTFRAILRQDPDIIFVGEIRDLETAEIAVQASNTGHLVLSTLHTNDAPSVVQRLLDLGLDGPSIASSLRASLGQRLVRRVCTECAGAGCATCTHSHYSGRAPVMELMVLDERLTELVSQEAPHLEIRRAALAGGMRPLHEVGMELVHGGVTDRAEVDRVLGEGDPEEHIPATAVPTLPPRQTGLQPPHPATEPDQGLSPYAPPRTAPASPAPASPVPVSPAPISPAPALPAVAPGGPSSDPQLAQQITLSVQPSIGELPGASRPYKGQVLVVDDDPVTRTIARSLLEADGFEVVEAADGMGAIQALQIGTPFSLCVLDLEMPNVGGREVLRHIRGQLRLGAMPVIVLTGTHDEQAEIELMEQGADDYVRKPLDAPRFMVRVRAVLRRHTAQLTA